MVLRHLADELRRVAAIAERSGTKDATARSIADAVGKQLRVLARLADAGADREAEARMERMPTDRFHPEEEEQRRFLVVVHDAEDNAVFGRGATPMDAVEHASRGVETLTFGPPMRSELIDLEAEHEMATVVRCDGGPEGLLGSQPSIPSPPSPPEEL
jgi:hypothetical protein